MLTDDYYMDLAIELALKGKGTTSPNPMVGALVVKNGKIIGKGFHKKAGGPHAEIYALGEARGKSLDATLYVTLEPCSYFGRTGPCTDAVIKSGIKKVIVGMRDPNPKNFGKGIRILKRHGIEVKIGLLEDKLKKLNQVFIKYVTCGLPFITVKVGQSLDGKIATRTGQSEWITSERSRAYIHNLRRFYDAILLGVNTIIQDDPLLNSKTRIRHIKIPVKIVVDSYLKTPSKARIFSKVSPGSVIIATILNENKLKNKIQRYPESKTKILSIKEKDGQVDLRDLLKKLANLEVTNILVEGGGTLIGSLFDEGLVDKVMFFIAPKIIGGKAAISSVMGKGITDIKRAIKLRDISFRRLGEDFLVEGYVK